MGKLIEYGEGGFDPTKPNNNIVREIDTPDVVEETTDEPVTIPVSALDQLQEAMGDTSVNSISEVKQALNNFVNYIKNT